MFDITSAAAARNVKAYYKLGLKTLENVQHVINASRMEFERGILTFMGPTPTGKTIVRFIARQKGNLKMLKGHFELAMSPEEAVRWAMKEGAFYKGLCSTKLSQFIGYKAEKILMDAASELDARAYLRTGGKKVAQNFDKRFVKGKVFALQTSSGHGIDLFGEFAPPPPHPPKWGTIDSKGTMKSKFGDYATPKGPGLSEKQLDGAENLYNHVVKALKSVKDKSNIYNLDDDQIKMLKEFYRDYRISKGNVQAYVGTVGLQDGFQLVTSSKKYPAGMIIIETIEEAAARDVRALARAARRAKKKAEEAAKKAKEAVDTAREEAGNAKELDDYAEAGRKIKQKEEEYRQAQQQVEEAAKNVERLENKVKDAMEQLKNKA